MENKSKGKHFLNLTLIAVSIFAAMYICAVSGYRFVRNENEEKKEIPEASSPVLDEAEKLGDAPSYENVDTKTASLPKNDIKIEPDNRDYLIIAEDGEVNLYIIDRDGNHTFSKKLDIDPDSLLDEDKAQLNDGIILNSQNELASLLEDYTS